MAKIIGIDLGTTNSLAAVLEAGKYKVINNAEGNHLTPSIVGFTKAGERLVGELAKRQAISNPERTIASIKRHMGTTYKVKIDDREYSAQEISAMILQKLKADAEAYLGETVEKAVITVPAYFNDAERQATKDSGTIAGLEVIRIVNEPTAAAMAYGLDKLEETQNVLVFDLGGGTFDVSILALDNGVFEVIATSGDMKLGGDDWDRRIMDYLVDEFKKTTSIDLRIDRIAMQRLKEAAEQAKWDLSINETTKINLPFVAADPSGPKHLEMEFTRQKFEELTEDLIERLSIPAKRALEDSKLPMAQLHKILLVGGATRMPMVQKMVKKLFAKDPATDVDPDKAIAIGAAIEAAVLSGQVKDLVLLDVNSLSLGIETTGGVFTRIIPRNTQIPCAKSKIFTTVADNQTTVEVRVFQGERELAQYNKFLGSFELKNIPSAARAVPQIEVSFDIDSNGIVNVSAKDLASGARQKITIQSPTNLTPEDIEKMMKEAAQFADQDTRMREERQMKNKANVEIEVAERTLKDFGEAAGKDETDKIRMQLEVLKGSLQNYDYETVKRETSTLQNMVFDFTATLYNPSLKENSQPQGEEVQAKVVETPIIESAPPNTENKQTDGDQLINKEELFDWFKKKK